MCFSAAASFGGGIVISSIGVAAVKEANKPAQLAFASIPLLFGLQQIAEGFLWLTLPLETFSSVRTASMYAFLILARVIWPAMIPLSVLLMEEDHRRRRILLVFLALGLAVSLYYAYCLAFLNVTPHIVGHHIQYHSDFPEALATPVFIVYFIASITPLFVSGNKRTRLLGALMSVSGVLSVIFFLHALTSVWCFSAAIISIVVYWILRGHQSSCAGL